MIRQRWMLASRAKIYVINLKRNIYSFYSVCKNDKIRIKNINKKVNKVLKIA